MPTLRKTAAQAVFFCKIVLYQRRRTGEEDIGEDGAGRSEIHCEFIYAGVDGYVDGFGCSARTCRCVGTCLCVSACVFAPGFEMGCKGRGGNPRTAGKCLIFNAFLEGADF